MPNKILCGQEGLVNWLINKTKQRVMELRSQIMIPDIKKPALYSQ